MFWTALLYMQMAESLDTSTYFFNISCSNLLRMQLNDLKF